MKKTAFLSASSGVLLATVFTAAASAWSFNLNGNIVCIPSGEAKITWTVDNTNEPEALTVIETSNYDLVPTGTTVGAGQTETFEQTVDGTNPGKHDLWLKVKWPSDQNPQSRNAQVHLNEECEQPDGGTGGGMGGGIGGGSVSTPAPMTAVTPAVAVSPAADVVAVAAPAEQPQVVAPAGAVDAGGGDTSRIAAFAVGMIGSAGMIAAGVRRFVSL